MIVKAVPDTRAQVSVTPADMAKGHTIKPTQASKEGRGFTSASRTKIENLGELDVPMMSREGLWTRQKWQVAPEGKLARPLLSIGEECDKGAYVVFGRQGGAIIAEDGQAIRKFPRLDSGVYEIEMWLPSAESLNKKFVFPGRADATLKSEMSWIRKTPTF